LLFLQAIKKPRMTEPTGVSYSPEGADLDAFLNKQKALPREILDADGYEMFATCIHEGAHFTSIVELVNSAFAARCCIQR